MTCGTPDANAGGVTNAAVLNIDVVIRYGDGNANAVNLYRLTPAASIDDATGHGAECIGTGTICFSNIHEVYGPHPGSEIEAAQDIALVWEDRGPRDGDDRSGKKDVGKECG